MPRISYWVSSQIWLSLEHFHNGGLTPDETKAAIEKIPDPGSDGMRLYCESSGLNSNWIVRTSSNSPRMHEFIVEEIGDALQRMLDQRKR